MKINRDRLRLRCLGGWLTVCLCGSVAVAQTSPAPRQFTQPQRVSPYYPQLNGQPQGTPVQTVSGQTVPMESGAVFQTLPTHSGPVPVTAEPGDGSRPVQYVQQETVSQGWTQQAPELRRSRIGSAWSSFTNRAKYLLPQRAESGTLPPHVQMEEHIRQEQQAAPRTKLVYEPRPVASHLTVDSAPQQVPHNIQVPASNGWQARGTSHRSAQPSIADTQTMPAQSETSPQQLPQLFEQPLSEQSRLPSIQNVTYRRETQAAPEQLTGPILTPTTSPDIPTDLFDPIETADSVPATIFEGSIFGQVDMTPESDGLLLPAPDGPYDSDDSDSDDSGSGGNSNRSGSGSGAYPSSGRMRDISEIHPFPSYVPSGSAKLVPSQELPQERSLSSIGTGYSPRMFADRTFHWEATNLFYRPLYFEDPSLERYGHAYPFILQPFMSGRRFSQQLVFLPYQWWYRNPCEPVSPLGYYRPGDVCTPMVHPAIPINPAAGAFQAGVAAGFFFAIP